MADFSVLVGVAAIIGIAIGGFIAGKAFYSLFVALVKLLTAKTRTTLDDYILKYIEGPLDVASIVLFMFLFSEFFSELSLVRELMAQYSLAILILISAYLSSEVVGAFLKWYYVEGHKKNKVVDLSIVPFFRKTSRIAIMLVGVAWSLAVIGIDVSAILTITSVVALILGLASQESLANIFAGIALQFDRPYVYGEYIRFITGEVVKLKKIGLRSTKFEDLNGNITVLSNSEFAKQRVTNLSRPTNEFKTTILFEVPTKYDCAKFEDFLLREIRAAKIEGLKKEDVSVAIEKVAKDHFVVSVMVWIADFPSQARAKNFLNSKALEYLQKHEK